MLNAEWVGDDSTSRRGDFEKLGMDSSRTLLSVLSAPARKTTWEIRMQHA